MAAILSEGVILEKVKNLIRQAMNILLVPLLVIGGFPLGVNNVTAAEGDDVPSTTIPEGVPEHAKNLVDNGDGTYTLSLSVTGKASSSTVQNVTKSNVILLVDTSNSMNSNATGYNDTRLAAEKNALTKTDGIIDKLLANNGDTAETADIIELYGINFGTSASTAWNWSADGSAIKSAINGLTTSRGTNWEEALILAKQVADAKHTAEPDENTYVIFMTDGEPTTHQNSYSVNTNYSQEWGYASDDARGIVTAGYTFYGIFTFGSGNSSRYLSSLVNYAYTGTGNSNSTLSPNYAKYFYDATDTQGLIDALEAIVDEISSNVGYTNIAMTDGLTDLASSMKVDGKISNLTYTRSGGSYGTGTVWTDAPEATTTNGSINWNLGSTVLEDGVTYTVSFLVWPAQESYDLVADLNNGKITYDELTDSQKTSVIKNSDGSYTFKTNIDYPTLTYSTITTTTSNAGTETVISNPTTINIENPKPVGLATEKLTLEKKWEDDLDPSQREEVNGEVVLNFYKDDDIYEQDIHLTESNNWKLNDYISIAPGIMISNDSPNYNLLKAGHTEYSFGGKTYIILETGHDYYFEEEDINSHFELTNYIYHPMIVDNVLMNVFFTRDESDNITGIEEFRVMESVSATNTLKGGINIQKKVIDKSGNEIDTDDSFEITAHLIDADGKAYKYDYRIYYGEKNPEYESHIVYNDDGSVRYSRSEHIYGTGNIEDVTLYLGDVIRIVNVDSGVQYYVEETEKDGYAANPTITYKEAYGTEEPTNATQTEDGYYVVSGNTASSATVINKFLDEKTKVEFEKTWYDASGNVLSGEELPGSITIELFKKGADGKVVSTGQTKKITADTDWKGSFTDLPKYDNGVEIIYSIEESAIEGATYNDELEAFFEYDSEENNGKHAVVGKWTVMTLEDFIVKNTWMPATESVTGKTSFNIVKVDKTTNKPLSGATFELKLKNGAAVTVTTNDDGEATFDNLDAGEYTLKETDAPEGYKKISTEPNINITSIKKLNTVDLENLKNIYEYVFSFSTSQVDGYEYNTESRTFTVKNEPIPYSDITVAKVWDDGDDRDGLRKNYVNYYIAVKNNSGKYVGYQKLVLEDKDNYEFTHLPLKTVDGEDITYEVVEASECSGSGNSIQCTRFDGDTDYTVTVANGVVTNFHEPALYGDLTVQKIWNDGNNELARPETIMIELYANGVRLGNPVPISAADGWKHTFENLYLNEDGEEIVYSVQESAIGENAFGDNESVIVILNDEGAIEGSWTKSEDNEKFEVTNTWKEAEDKVVYEGDTQFTIKKVDEDYKPLSDVVFAVEGHSDKTTNENGEITITVPISKDGKEESFEYVISEKEAKEGYDLVDGSATVTISCTSELTDRDTDNLINTYTKICTFSEEGDNGFNWDEEDLTLTVIDKRSMAKSLVIRKTFSGVNVEILKDVTFTITGPEDFGEDGEMTLTVGKDCTLSDDEIVCKVNGKIPTGEYTVEEDNAEIENFTLEVSGDNGKTKDVEKDARVEFKINNKYTADETVYSVVKVWDDGHDYDGKRPDSLTVKLSANSEVIETIEMTMDDAVILDEEEEYYATGDVWVYTWEELPYVDEYAKVINYSAEEFLESDDYEQTDTEGDEYYVLFVNTHELDDPCASGEGCGGGGPVEAPETGELTNVSRDGGVYDAGVNSMIGGFMVIVMSGMMVIFSAIRRKSEEKK